MENLERSWKKSWKVMEFKELKRVRTLKMYLNAIKMIDIDIRRHGSSGSCCWYLFPFLSLVVSGDQTEILRAGYWPSYNVPFYEQVVHYCSHSSAFDVKISSSLSGATTLRSRETWNACAWDFIACATDETKLTLFKTVCETAPKSLFWVPTCVPGFEYASWLAF